MNHLDIPITIQHIDTITSTDIAAAESLFIGYFTFLYKEISSLTLGLNKPTAIYLKEVFNKTKQALCQNQLFLSFAFMENTVVGMSTYELVENKTILIRTLPINLNYIGREEDIRIRLINHVYERFTFAQNAIIMVRKANNVHQNLCIDNGFKQTEQVFDIPFIKQQYDCNHYFGYMYTLS